MNEYPLERSVEISKMRKLMNYGLSDYREDWNLALSLAMLMESGNRNYFHIMLDSCFRRIQAFSSNNPEVTPFDYSPNSEGSYDDMVKLCQELKR